MEKQNSAENRSQAEARRAPELVLLRKLPKVSPVPAPTWASTKVDSQSKARGIGYERKVKSWLSQICAKAGWVLWDHQWFKYECDGKIRYFQPDFIIERPGETSIVAEAKLTYVDTSLQLKEYVNHLLIYGLVCLPITIVRNLTPAAKDIVFEFDKIRPNSVLHLWL